MDKRKGPSPLSIVWQWAKEEHKEFYAAIVLAVIGVAGTMTAYFGMAALIPVAGGHILPQASGQPAHGSRLSRSPQVYPDNVRTLFPPNSM